MDEELFGASFIPDDVAPPTPPPQAPVDPDRIAGSVNAPIKMSARDLDLMARMVMMESGGESDDGQRGVASVILNRAQSGRYGQGVYGVITKQATTRSGKVVAQFEPWGNDKTRAAMMAVPTDNPRYQRAMANSLAMINGDAPDPTNGATHFLNKSTSAARGDSAMKPGGWGHTGADQIKIGNHTFMKADAGATGAGRQAAMARAQSGPRASVIGSGASTPGIGRSERVPTPPPRPSGILTGDSEQTALEIDKQLKARLGQPETPKPGLDPKAGLNAPEDSSGGEDSSLRGGGGILTGGPGGATKNILPPLGRGAQSLGQGVLQAAQPSAPASMQAAQAGTIAPLVPKQLQAAVPLPPARPADLGGAAPISAPAIPPPQIETPAPPQSSPLIGSNRNLPGFGTPDNQGRTFGTPNVGARPSLAGAGVPMPSPAAPRPTDALAPPPAPPAGILASPPALDPDRFARDAPGPLTVNVPPPMAASPLGPAPTSLAGSAAPGGRSMAELAGILSGGFAQARDVAGAPLPGRRRKSGSSMTPSSPELQTGSLLQGGILAGAQGGLDLNRFYGLLSGRVV